MQRIILFLFLVLLFGSSLFSQKNSTSSLITIEESRISVGELLREITRQSGMNFSFNSRLLDKEEYLSFFVKEAKIEDCLDELSEKLNIRYLLVEGQIVLTAPRKQKKKEPLIVLSGFLSDRSSGESLIGAVVHAIGTSFGTFTNEFGYYALALKPGKYRIAYSHIGYKKSEQEINLQEAKRSNIAMPPVSFDLSEILIGPPMSDILNKKQLDVMEMTADDLNNMPEFVGESGLVKGLQTLPGLTTDGDGSAYFYARGGERDQNLVIIDDAPVYNPSHLFGFYSMVMPDFVKSIQVYKGDMPANMGDRLSSIVSIRTQDGNLNKWQLTGAINPFVSRFSLDIPIQKKKSSLFISSRQSNFDWLYRKNSPQLEVNFKDFHLKWNQKINKNNRIYLTTISGSDILRNFSPELGTQVGIRRNNFSATLRWNHLFNPKLFLNTIIYTGSYGNRLLFQPNFWKSELGMLGLKTDFTHYANPGFQSKFGLEVQGYFTNPGSLSVDSSLSLLPSLRPNYSRKTVLYYQGEWEWNDKLRLRAGVRLINWARLGPDIYYNYDLNYQISDTLEVGSGIYNRFINADPRISLQYQIGKSSQIKLSYGIYHQYLQLISNSRSPYTPLEVWIPSGPNVWPQSSKQWSLGYLNYFEKAQMEISLAAYHKNQDGQIDYVNHANTYQNPLIEGELRFGTSRSYGIEFLLKKNFGPISGWMAYTYARTFRKTSSLNDGKEYPAFQDRPHEFSLFLNYPISRRALATVYWTSYSGSTFSSPSSFLNFNGQTVPIFSERNNDRLPAYHRMDISVKFILNKRETAKYQHSLNFSIHNFLARKNVYAVKFNKIVDGSRPPVVQNDFLSEHTLSPSQVYSLGRFFPSLSYRFNL